MLGVPTWFSAVLLLLISYKSAVLTEAPSWNGETPDPNGPVVIPNATLDVMYGETVSFAREYLFQYQYTFAEVKGLFTVPGTLFSKSAADQQRFGSDRVRL